MEVVWKGNIFEPGVYAVEFGPEFFTAEGFTIAPGTWWDFKHPPIVSSSPLWTGDK